jgi:hypothetical protein
MTTERYATVGVESDAQAISAGVTLAAVMRPPGLYALRVVFPDGFPIRTLTIDAPDIALTLYPELVEGAVT